MTTGVSHAVVVTTLPGSDAVVGGLPLAVRVVLALHRAGVPRVDALGEPPAGTRAVMARRAPATRWLAPDDGVGAPPGPVLVAAGNVLVGEAAFGPVLAGVTAGGPVALMADSPGPPRVIALLCPGPTLPRLLASLRGGVATLEDALPAVDASGEPARRVRGGPAIALAPPETPARLEAALLDRLASGTTAGDSYLATLIDRRLSRPVTRWLLPRAVTPSQITVLSVVFGLVGATGLATVSYGWRVAGLVLLVASIVLDCVDGEVARARLEQSPAGARLDVAGDYLVHLATFGGLIVGLLRQGLPRAGLWAGGALLGGVMAAMVVVHRLLVRPALDRGDLHFRGEGGGLRGSPVGDLVDKLASRDYTYLLLVLGVADRLGWFLYAAAAGSWAFVVWLLVLSARGAPARRGPIVAP